MSNELPESVQTTSPPNSGMAVVSLVSGILGLTLFPFIGGIVALITGYMARNEIRESEGEIGGEGFAIAGIVMGWIAVGLLVIACCCILAFALGLFGLTIPVFSSFSY